MSESCRRFLACCVLGLASSCASDIVAPSALLGEWGGPGAGLSVTAASARVSLTCGGGEIDLPIILDPEGRFLTGGRRWFIGGVPPRPEDPPPFREPVVYSGRVDGDRLTLTIDPALSDGAAMGPAYTYRLRRGRPAEVLICP